ncbi:polyprenyl synthetase family protein [Nocardia sp. NPDC003963]
MNTETVRGRGPARERCHPVFVTDSSGWSQRREQIRAGVQAELARFRATVPSEPIAGVEVDQVLRQYAGGGKCVRSVVMYLGWLCGGDEDEAALRACAAIEFLHAFALLQDDVMDSSTVRRGTHTAHLQFTEQHRELGMAGSARRFGESAATLLGDMCLVWAEQMMRGSGVPAESLARVWPHYDQMRIELARGQFADLANDVRASTIPALESVLAIARAKSGDYTVKWPVVMGAAMAGCDDPVTTALAGYGRLVGEAFQLRDDLLGVFGAPEVTGKPGDNDITEHKANTVIVAALAMAGPRLHHRLTTLLRAPVHDPAAIEDIRALIIATGAPTRVEEMIEQRLAASRQTLSTAPLPASPRAMLDAFAESCAARKY